MSVVSRSEAPRALITGLRGFTGFYVAQALAGDGYEVYGTAHGSELAGDRVYHVDLCDPTALQRVIDTVQPQVVAHLAAISFVAHGDADAIYRVNVIGTRNLLAALASLDEKPQAVLLASSANIYGNAQVALIDESVQPAPANDYAVSKLAMEYVARLWMDQLPIVIARPFNYTGVGQAPNFLLPKIVGHFQRGEKRIELGNIEVERDFSDVRMVAQAYARLLRKVPAGEVYNVCSGVTWSLKAVLAQMAEIAGYEIEVHVNPTFVRASEVQRLQGDCGKLKQAIGAFEHISLQETLRWMYAHA